MITKLKFTKFTLRRVGIALAAGLILGGAMYAELLFSPDNGIADSLYQREVALDGNVVLINIDQRALEEIGPFQTWGRGITAELITALNANPDLRPAIIGVDTIFAGTTDPAEDARLAAAAGEYGNVLVAATATFGSAVITNEDGDFYLDNTAIEAFDEPFAELGSAAEIGHINAMNDSDGILRRCILQLNLPDGRVIPSFNYKIAQLYAQSAGLPLITPPPLDGGSWYLPFSSKAGGFDDGFSVVDVLSGELPAELLADKIVLIGPYAAGLRDTITAAIDHATPMYGVEYQANAITALLSGNYKQEVPLLPQCIALAVVGFIAMLWFRDRRILPSTIAWLGTSMGYLGLCLLCYEQGYLLSPLYLPLGVTMLYIIAVAANYVRVAMEKRRVTSTFQRYVAPEIVNEILKEGSQSLNLGGRLTDIAVLFVDIRGFTPMSEGLPPETVVEILNRYLTLTSDCIFKNNGTLDKFVGDATMAFWGAPLPQEDCIFKAVKAALDMVDGASVLSAHLQEKFGRSVSFGIGIHYGPAVVGNIGSPNRMDYTAIGDTVNTAARLESSAKGGTILLSRVVADAIEGRATFTSLGDSIKLKGKADGFEVLTLDGLV